MTVHSCLSGSWTFSQCISTYSVPRALVKYYRFHPMFWIQLYLAQILVRSRTQVEPGHWKGCTKCTCVHAHSLAHFMATTKKILSYLWTSCSFCMSTLNNKTVYFLMMLSWLDSIRTAWIFWVEDKLMDAVEQVDISKYYFPRWL